MPADWYCPPEAGCPYPGEPADEPGCLIVMSGDGGLGNEDTKLTWSYWVSDSGSELGMRRELWADLPFGIEADCRDAAQSVGITLTPTPRY